MYKIMKFPGLAGEMESATSELIVHMIHPGNAVELFLHGATENTVTLSREQFTQMAAWVNQEFDALSNQEREIN